MIAPSGPTSSRKSSDCSCASVWASAKYCDVSPRFTARRCTASDSATAFHAPRDFGAAPSNFALQLADGRGGALGVSPFEGLTHQRRDHRRDNPDGQNDSSRDAQKYLGSKTHGRYPSVFQMQREGIGGLAARWRLEVNPRRDPIRLASNEPAGRCDGRPAETGRAGTRVSGLDGSSCLARSPAPICSAMRFSSFAASVDSSGHSINRRSPLRRHGLDCNPRIAGVQGHALGHGPQEQIVRRIA